MRGVCQLQILVSENQQALIYFLAVGFQRSRKSITSLIPIFAADSNSPCF
jgi:hypothetical protein